MAARRLNNTDQHASDDVGGKNEEAKDNTDELSQRKNPLKGNNKEGFFVIFAVFTSSLLILYFVYSKFPQLEENEIIHIKLPRDIEDAKKLGNVLNRYKEKYYYEVLGGVFIVYIFLQSFAIPGSIFLSILSGFLFSFYVALVLICLCSAIGASLCYSLSSLVGKNIVQTYFPERASKWAEQVNRHSDHLIYYIIFLRITPFLPNWFINITSPVIGVPLWPFFLGTFVGVAPPSFVAIQAGMTLQELTSSSDALSYRGILLIIVFSILALVPVVLKNRIRDKVE